MSIECDCGGTPYTGHDEDCPSKRRTPAEQPALASTGREPVLWFKRLPGAQAKPDGRCYEVMFAPLDGYTPLFDLSGAARELDVEAERQDFEAECKGDYENMGGEYAGPGNEGWWYWSDETAAAWDGWLRRAARSAAQGTAPVDTVNTSSERVQNAQGNRHVENERQELPAVLFDGHAVYSEITRHLGKAHCHNPDTVSATLDAVVRLMRVESAPVSTEQAAMWSALIRDTNATPCKYPSLRDDLADWLTDKGIEQAGDAWISVEDRLPEDCTFVAIFDPENDGMPVRTAHWLAGSRTFESEYGWLAWDEVSHWMPLPAAPSPNNSPVGGKGEQ